MATKVADALEADACFVYLYDERSNELVLRATHGTSVEEMTRRPRMRPGEGITGAAAAERSPVMIPSQAHLDPRFKLFPNLPEEQYESILAVPILVHGERLAGALNVRTREPRVFVDAEIGLLTAIADQVAQSIVHAQLYSRRTAQGRRARSARADLRGGLRVALPRGVARGDRQDDDGRREGDGGGARARGRADRLAGGACGRPRGAHAAPLEAAPDRRARRRPRLAVLRRRPRAARGDRAPCGGRARARARGHARRARARDPSPREEQPADGRLAAAPAVARARSRSAGGARALGQPDPRHRSGARGADRAARGGRRAGRPDRPAARDARAGARRRTCGGGEPRAGLARRQPRDGARARVQRAAPERARARSGPASGSSSRAATARSCSRSPTTAQGPDDAAAGTGLSIVRALVRDELQGSFDLRHENETRAEVVFPA